MRWGIDTRRLEPISCVDAMTRDFNVIFNDLFTGEPVHTAGTVWAPRIDVTEDEKGIYVIAELPGMDEKDLNLQLEHNVLTISGEKKESLTEENKDKNYRYSERRFGSFTRTIALPDEVKADAISAHFKNGLLEISLPKSEAALPKKIAITVN